MLVRAALEPATRGALAVVHAHDWQSRLAAFLHLKTLYAAHPVLGGTPSIFTIHNLAYQGVFAADWLPRLDLGWEQFTIDRLEYWGRISFMKGGINDARTITTVSPRYAQEIQTPEFGFGFDGILRGAARRSRRHPERHRHGAVGSGARSVPARAVRRRPAGRQSRLKS